MSETIWINREPGETVSHVVGEPETLLAYSEGGGGGDWVRLPEELGGYVVRTLGTYSHHCLQCRRDKPVPLYELEDRYVVTECNQCGFVWARKPEGDRDE